MTSSATLRNYYEVADVLTQRPTNTEVVKTTRIEAERRSDEALKRQIGSFLLIAILSCGSTCRMFAAQEIVDVQSLSSHFLKPPGNAKVAIIEFNDLECTACAAIDPALARLTLLRHIPLVRHDLLIPGHVWSPEAAIVARWFDAKSDTLGSQYRASVLANQALIATVEDMQKFSNDFGRKHGVIMPSELDPDGALAAAVRSDVEAARALGLVATPTLFVVTYEPQSGRHIIMQCESLEKVALYLDHSAARGSPHRDPSATHKIRTTCELSCGGNQR